MPSGVDCNEPLVPKGDGVEAGELREDGMLMAPVMRVKDC